LIQYTNDTGKPVEIRLPDGSLVTLNTGAVMNYPHVFQKKTREVQLTGEAYFSVLKNPKGPFVIKTENSFIRVLGTSFNVRALKNEDRVIVTVEEGRVEFGYALEQKKAKVEITAGETGLLEKGNKLSRVSTRDNNYLAWKTGTLTFIKTPLMEVIHAVERYFFIKIKSENSALDSVSVDVTLYRDNEAEMIRTIEMLIGYKIIPKDSLYIITTEPI
jgi:transmembrane sensor